MVFEHNPGTFTLFPNDRKETGNQPDFKGSGKLLGGAEVWVSAWKKQSREGKTYLSCSITLKDEAPDR